jgi:hypothetical protein
VPDEPIRERILQHCENSLRAIDGTEPYWSTLADVERGRPVPGDLKRLAVAFIDEGDEAVSQDTSLLNTRLLPLTVEVRVRSDAGSLPTVGNRMLADVERALTVDPTRGGLAKYTRLTGTSIPLQDEGPGVLASVRAQFEIQFYTRQGNPGSKG